MSDIETTNDPCPKRGPGLSHAGKGKIEDSSGAIMCEFCQAMVSVVVPPITKPGAGKARVPAAPISERMSDEGLIDRLLGLRSRPLAEAMSKTMLTTGMWDAYCLGIDSALDLLVPALRELVILEAVSAHTANCVHKPSVEEIIGRVPLRGWRKPA